MSRSGSSPLTRGKPDSARRAFAQERLIPAHAGKTNRAQGMRERRGAHPRSRGENFVGFAPGGDLEGSSPLTRGKRRALRQHGQRARLIPAHAGKTLYSPRSAAPRPAHPRSRGENHRLGVVPVIPSGSSPLTRGKLQRVAVIVDPLGLIPAHAGKTSRAWKFSMMGPAHPRSRGENPMRSRTLTAVSGSSPLTRGKRESGPAPARGARLIPAHAGKTRGHRRGRR